ncbi:cell wall-binding repeat-containing protein [Clostridium sp. BSD9I1]|uniref:cell wall-binding repeat-containing protein n=1 Tax=Clostridium sp. BSD9I1 TaxID=2003589 RepID=UPI0016475F77|nr:cell wall-binding repeat-containing protein [Clostridium sp. BSD9I1]
MNFKRVSRLMITTILAVTVAQGFNPISVQAETIQLTKTAKRVQGLDRFKTSRAIAEEIGFTELENVVITSGYGFADGLSAGTFAKKLNAPLLLAGDLKSSSEAIAYISGKLKSNGNVYIIGGEGVVSKETENVLTSKGYKVTRIFGKGRIETNDAIINELEVTQGTPVFISNALGYADALSASGVAAIKDYPMLLTNADKLPDVIKDQLTKIKPSKVYIVGGEAVVKPAVVNEIKTILPSVEIVRLGGSSRYETSMSIFNEFNLDSKNIVLASGKGFADALSGSQLAAKLNAPMVLADETNLFKQQSEFDKKALENYYLLGGTGSLTTNVEQIAVMNVDKEFQDINTILTKLAQTIRLKIVGEYLALFDLNTQEYKEARQALEELFKELNMNDLDIIPTYKSINVISMNATEAKVKTRRNDAITDNYEKATEYVEYTQILSFRKVNGQWKIYNAENIQ